ncbi:MAG TPA: PDZ domain-containing protein [Gemmataceae bacterium]|jgi:S1-C subfamily serine protease
MRSMIVRKLFTGAALAGLLAAAPLATAAPDGAAGRPYLGLAAEAAATGATPHGVTVHSVAPDSPAAKAGLKGSDRIVMADGKEVKSFDDLKQVLSGHKPGDRVTLKVMRDGREQTVTAALGEAPKSRDRAEPPARPSGPFLGVFTQPLTAELKGQLGVTVEKGAVVTRVLPESPAATAGLADKDVVTHFGDAAVNTPQDLREAVRKAGAGQDVTVKVMRGAKAMEFKVRLQDAPAGAAGLPGFVPGMPEGFENFPGQLQPFFSGMEKVPALEKKLQDLENRVHELEQKK